METVSRLLLTFLLNSLWQVTLVAGVAALGAWMLRNGPARYGHGLWAMALGLAVLLPLWSASQSLTLSVKRTGWAKGEEGKGGKGTIVRFSPFPHSPFPQTATGYRGIADPATGSALLVGLSRREWPVQLSPRWADAILLGYLLTLLFRGVRLCRAWYQANEVRQSAPARPLPAWVASSVWRCQVALGLGSVPILVSSCLRGPVVIGARRAAIILPAQMLEGSSAEDLTSTLCHEMAHIRRHDFLMNLVYELCYLLIAFHPAGVLIKRRIDQTRELACDEMAAGRLVSSSAYARSLVNLARTMFDLPSASCAGTLGVFDADILEERVMRLLDKKRRASPRMANLALAGVLSSLALVGMAATLFSLSVTEKSVMAMPGGPHTDFSGRWKLDKTKSALPSASPDDLVEVIDHRDPQLRITTTSKDWSADFWLNIQKPIAVTLFALTIPEWVATTDGVERSEKYGPAELKSKTYWEGERLITAWSLERDGRPEITGEWVRSLSADGRTQSLEIQVHDPQRSAKGEAKLVFVKSSGNSVESFLGTWQAEFRGKTFIVVELKRENDTMTGTMSPFTIELDASGNLTKAERGDHGGWDVVEAELDQNGLALKCKDRETGDIDRFQMRLIGDKEALLSPVGAPAPPAGPQPFRLRRVSEHDIVGIRGGVRGGVGDGVRGGSVNGVPGGVADGVRGGVVWPVSQSVKNDPREERPSISGTVCDPSGARVPNAVVNVMNDSSVVKRATVTNDVGEFAFAVIPPGRYQVEVIGPGFAAYHQRISVPGATEALPSLNVVLQPSSMMESVEVTAKVAPGTRSTLPNAVPRRIRVGGLVQAGKLVEQKKPEYPESARLRGIEGVVLLEAVISMEGVPLNWKVLSSPDPDLSEAAINAVRQWRYEPTLLNGEPIEVVTTISVRFRLEDSTAPGSGT